MIISDPLFVRALDILTEGIDPGQGRNRLTGQAAKRVRELNQSWMSGPTIVGFGISAKMIGGKPVVPHSLALRVYVAEKNCPKDHHLKIPTSINIPRLGKFPMDVIESGPVKALGRKDKMRPPRPGCSLAGGVSPGTMGCLVKKIGSKEIFVLGNCHILANDGARDPCDPNQDQGIYQPGSNQIGENVIATLFEKIPFCYTDCGYPNIVDAAIAQILDGIEISKCIIGIGIPSGIATPASDPHVKKSGAYSAITEGLIKDINGKFWETFTKPNGMPGRVGFKNQVVVERENCTYFSQSGDSGSMIVNSKNQLVGMLWGGTEFGKNKEIGSKTPIGICNDINVVFQKLNIELA